MNNDALLPLVEDMLEQRRVALEKINEMFGTNISVDFASSWEKLLKEFEAESNQLDMEEGEDDAGRGMVDESEVRDNSSGEESREDEVSEEVSEEDNDSDETDSTEGQEELEDSNDGNAGEVVVNVEVNVGEAETVEVSEESEESSEESEESEGESTQLDTEEEGEDDESDGSVEQESRK